jgi:hypothetical protein
MIAHDNALFFPSLMRELLQVMADSNLHGV